MNKRINTTFRNGVKKWQVEGEGSFGFWYPMGSDVLFDTEQEAIEAMNDPYLKIYRRNVTQGNQLRFG